MEEKLDQFLEQILVEKDLNTVEGEVREQVKAEMAERLSDQINMAVINALPEEKAIELAAKLDDENFGEAETMKFVEDAGVDTAKIAMDTMVQFRALYLAGSERVDEVADEKISENGEAAE